MIIGAHAIVYSKDADADRAFLKDVLGFPYVDAGEGWLVFRLPPAAAPCEPAVARRARRAEEADAREEERVRAEEAGEAEALGRAVGSRAGPATSPSRP